MGQFICQFEQGPQRWWFVWSTVVDAPITYAMTLDELRAYIRHEEGCAGLRELPARIERALRKGTSSHVDDSLAALIVANRAGPNESEASLAEIEAALLAGR